MKTFKLCFLAFTLFLLSFSEFKAQDDPNTGILIDGTLAETFTTWNFKEIKVVFQLDQKWMSKYEFISVSLKYLEDYNDPKYDKNEFDDRVVDFKRIESKDYVDYSDAKYVLANMCRTYLDNGGKTVISYREYRLNQHSIAHAIESDAAFPSTKRALFYIIKGHSITGHKEEWDGKAYVKKPIYDATLLYKSKKTEYPICICKWSKKEYKRIHNVNTDWNPENFECESCKPILTEPCKVTGKPFSLPVQKVDFEGKFSKVTGGSVSDNSKETSNTKTESKTITTTEKVTTAPAVSSSALKPLDKKKPGYFADRSGNFITREGYKRDGTLNGEIRIYNDEGKLTEIITYLKDEKTGSYAKYDAETGNILLSGQYKNGLKDGEWTRYNNGKKVGTDTYVEGDKQ